MYCEIVIHYSKMFYHWDTELNFYHGIESSNYVVNYFPINILKWINIFCFVLANCRKLLDSGKITEHDGEMFCGSCYSKNFGPKGYGFGGGSGTLSMDDGKGYQVIIILRGNSEFIGQIIIWLCYYHYILIYFNSFSSVKQNSRWSSSHGICCSKKDRISTKWKRK